MSTPPRRNSLLPLLAPLLGVAMIAAAAGADLLGGSGSGFGRSQLVLLTFGAILFLGGVFLPVFKAWIGPALALGVAAAATSFGLIDGRDLCTVLGAGAAIAAILADLSGDRRFLKEWLDAKPL